VKEKLEMVPGGGFPLRTACTNSRTVGVGGFGGGVLRREKPCLKIRQRRKVKKGGVGDLLVAYKTEKMGEDLTGRIGKLTRTGKHCQFQFQGDKGVGSAFLGETSIKPEGK